MAVSDADIQKQILHLIAFIEHEANEKVAEIDADAEEEFAFERGRLVNQNRSKIMEFYDRKEKQVVLKKKIGSSNLLNKSRLEVLKAQEQHIKNVLVEARQLLSKITTNKAAYAEIITKLICQGLCQFMEPKVTLRCREADSSLVEQCLPKAVQEYQVLSKKNVNVTIDIENWLPAQICGGVEMSSRNGRIKLSNTLEARLELLALQMLPEIRGTLFGHNPNRKFDN